MRREELKVGLKVFLHREGHWYRGTIQSDYGNGNWAVIADESITFRDGSVWSQGGPLACHSGELITWAELKEGDTIVSTRHRAIEISPLQVYKRTELLSSSSCHPYIVHIKDKDGTTWGFYKNSGARWDLDACKPKLVAGWPKKTESEPKAEPAPVKWDPKQGDVVTVRDKGYDRRAVILRIDPSTRLKYLLVIEQYYSPGVCATKSTAVRELPNTAQKWTAVDDIAPCLGAGTRHYSRVQDIIECFSVWWDKNNCPPGTAVRLTSGTYVGRIGKITEWSSDGGLCRVQISDGKYYQAYPWQYYPIAALTEQGCSVFDHEKIEQRIAQLQAQYPVHPREAFGMPPPLTSCAEVFSAPKAGKTGSMGMYDQIQSIPRELPNGAAAIDPLPVPKLVSLDDDITILKPL